MKGLRTTGCILDFTERFVSRHMKWTTETSVTATSLLAREHETLSGVFVWTV